MAQWIYWTFAGLISLIILCVWIIKRKNLEIDILQEQHDAYATHTRKLIIASVNARYSRVVNEVKEMYRKQSESLPPTAMINFRDPFPLEFFEDFDNNKFPFELPRGVTITRTGEAALGDISEKRPFGKYTVFVSHSGKCYHSPFCNYSQLTKPACIFTAMQYRTPCSFCRPTSPKSIPVWYTNFCAASRSLRIDWSENSQ